MGWTYADVQELPLHVHEHLVAKLNAEAERASHRRW
jgi:hypothetical protein